MDSLACGNCGKYKAVVIHGGQTWCKWCMKLNGFEDIFIEDPKIQLNRKNE